MEETAIRWRNARAELSGALLRASEVEKRYAVSGSMIKVGGAETLGASRVWWRGAARLRSKAQRLDHGVTGCHVVSWGRKKGRSTVYATVDTTCTALDLRDATRRRETKRDVLM